MASAYPTEPGRLLRSATVSIAIHCRPHDVYEFVADLEHLPQWGTSFIRGIRRVGDEWIADTSQGPTLFRLAPRNALGIVDHYVTPPQGGEVYVPMRIVVNGDGSEVLFTVFQQPGMSDEAYAADLAFVQQDLRTLKAVLERRRPAPRQ